MELAWSEEREQWKLLESERVISESRSAREEGSGPKGLRSARREALR